MAVYKPMLVCYQFRAILVVEKQGWAIALRNHETFGNRIESLRVRAEHAGDLLANDVDAEVENDAAEDPAGGGTPGVYRLADIAKAAALKAERAVIEETLHGVQWNRRRAAAQLGVSYKTLLNKIKECGINPKLT